MENTLKDLVTRIKLKVKNSSKEEVLEGLKRAGYGPVSDDNIFSDGNEGGANLMSWKKQAANTNSFEYGMAA